MIVTETSPRYHWTYSDYARLPDDGNHYEVLDGELLVTPGASPSHQHIASRLERLLHAYVDKHGLGIVFRDVDLLFQTGQFLRPDLLFVPNDAREGITNAGIEREPGLVVEVLSPTSHAIDKVKKPRRYADFGVPEYWVVDPEEQCLWVWRFAQGNTEPERVTNQLVWQPMGGPEPLLLMVSDLFEPF
jgi:Uma2 family endonuclease